MANKKAGPQGPPPTQSPPRTSGRISGFLGSGQEANALLRFAASVDQMSRRLEAQAEVTSNLVVAMHNFFENTQGERARKDIYAEALEYRGVKVGPYRMSIQNPEVLTNSFTFLGHLIYEVRPTQEQRYLGQRCQDLQRIQAEFRKWYLNGLEKDPEANLPTQKCELALYQAVRNLRKLVIDAVGKKIKSDTFAAGVERFASREDALLLLEDAAEDLRAFEKAIAECMCTWPFRGATEAGRRKISHQLKNRDLSRYGDFKSVMEHLLRKNGIWSSSAGDQSSSDEESDESPDRRTRRGQKRKKKKKKNGQ